VGSLLGLLLSFRINFSMGRWQDGMVAERTLLGTAKQIVTQCAFIDDAFSPTLGKGNPNKTGPHSDAFERSWQCMKVVNTAPSPDDSPVLRQRRRTEFDSVASDCSIHYANGMSDAAGAILRIRHLVLAVCELTGKHVRFDSGE
jgi:hypothetical protein